ncbi:MAG: DUF3035 domain-containing protein [Alphaproteobacteria bacterium]
MSKRLTVVMIVVCFAVSSCSNKAKQALGLSRKAPDEFTVISRAPLTIPPVFNMRPPKPGETRPQEGTALDAAKTALITNGETAQGNTNSGNAVSMNDSNLLFPIKQNSAMEFSSGEKALLTKANAEDSQQDIRKVIDQENSSLIKESKQFVDKIVFWKETEDPTAIEVDPTLEEKRIQENAALGKTVTEGETPVIEKRRKGIFEK